MIEDRATFDQNQQKNHMQSNNKAKNGLHWLAACMLTLPAVSMTAQLSFSPPDGGWNYLYEGDQADYAPDGEGFASLDGTWSHDNGSDQWDGSAIGGDFGDGN